MSEIANGLADLEEEKVAGLVTGKLSGGGRASHDTGGTARRDRRRRGGTGRHKFQPFRPVALSLSGLSVDTSLMAKWPVGESRKNTVANSISEAG